MQQAASDRGASLYVHIPFCVRKCEYCDFYSEAATERDIDRYLACLERELEPRAGLRPETVFIGGGTPTRLSERQLRQLADIFARRVNLGSCREFTCEINPGTLTPAKADALRALGVTRASFGVQSFEPRFLEALGRGYEAGTAENAVRMAREAGIGRVSVDLMFALPGQTLDDLRSDLARALELGTEHLSFYALTFEDDTPLTRELQAGRVQPCPEALELEMFELVGETCARAGLERYEVSNFAKPGAECAHNLVYWQLGNWLGVGAGAHSWLDGLILENAGDHRAWCDAIEAGRSPIVRHQQLSGIEQAESLLLMGLRLTRGVSLANFERLAGASFDEVCGARFHELARQGLLEQTGGRVHATRRGLLVLDRVIVELAEALTGATP